MNLAKIYNPFPEEVQIKATREILAEKYRQSLFTLTKVGLGYEQVTKETHLPICRMLQSETKKKLLVVPRGCFKSTLASIAFPIWCLINDFNHRILLDSELYTNSSKFLREIKGHLESKNMTDLFGQFRTDFNWNEGEITIKQRTKIYKESSITCSGIGAQKTSQHYTIIIADDMNSPDNSMSEELREKVIDHYKLYISLLEPGGTIVVIGTRYSQNDLIGHILSSEINPEQKKGLIY